MCIHVSFPITFLKRIYFFRFFFWISILIFFPFGIISHPLLNCCLLMDFWKLFLRIRHCLFFFIFFIIFINHVLLHILQASFYNYWRFCSSFVTCEQVRGSFFFFFEKQTHTQWKIVLINIFRFHNEDCIYLLNTIK